MCPGNILDLETNFFGRIPLAPELGKLADSGKLISSKESEVYKIFTEIGKKITDTKPKKIPLNISIN